MSDSNEWIEGRASNPADDDAGISELLDTGYDQLDGFVQWLEQDLRVDTRTAHQDCFNAEAFVDYLANMHHKSAGDVNEFELRWFLFSHYIRKAMADEATAARLLISLQRFFQYLESEHTSPVPAFVTPVLEDVSFYHARRHAYAELDTEDERRWQEGFRTWSAELEDDLDSRCLWLPRDLGRGLAWGDAMGWREMTLHDEANRNWQCEREELLGFGLDYEAIREDLLQSYLVWTETPQMRLDGKTPVDIIEEERLERADEADEDSDPDEDMG